MDGQTEHPYSRRLLNLARQLSLHRPPHSGDDDKEQRTEEVAGRARKVVSQVGIPESHINTTANYPKRFRPKRAAVLICLFQGDAGDMRVILTKRSSRLSTHSGHVALPGGRPEPSDKDDTETATREAKEEIGLDPSLVNVITVMEPFLSKDLFEVVPVIGILKDRKAFNPCPNPEEVETVFDVPLEMFLRDENMSSEEKELMGMKYRMYFFNYETLGEEYLIWGITAWILIEAAMLVFERPPAFILNIPKFRYDRLVAKNTTT